MKTNNHIQKLVLTTILMIGFQLFSTAQVSVNIVHTSPYRFTTNDLWNMSIINSSSDNQQVDIKVTLLDAQSKQVVTATLKNYVLHPGGNMVKPSDVAAVFYNYATTEAADGLKQYGQLNYGTYYHCVDILSGQQVLTNNCQSFQVEPFSSPILASPFNTQEIYTRLPILTWSGPLLMMPPKKDDQQVKKSELTYSLVIKELKEDQSREDAMNRNLVLFQKTSLRNHQLQYPASATKLEVNKTYVWQITSVVDNEIINRSEVWEFTIINDEQVEKIYENGYALLKKKDDEIHMAYHALKFIFIEQYNAGPLNYQIIDSKGNDVTPKHIQLSTVHGENKFEVSITDMGLKQGETYTLKVTSRKREVYQLKFKCYKHYEFKETKKKKRRRKKAKNQEEE